MASHQFALCLWQHLVLKVPQSRRKHEHPSRTRLYDVSEVHTSCATEQGDVKWFMAEDTPPGVALLGHKRPPRSPPRAASSSAPPRPEPPEGQQSESTTAENTATASAAVETTALVALPLMDAHTERLARLLTAGPTHDLPRLIIVDLVRLRLHTQEKRASVRPKCFAWVMV
jgi:hypothetical protein